MWGLGSARLTSCETCWQKCSVNRSGQRTRERGTHTMAGVIGGLTLPMYRRSIVRSCQNPENLRWPGRANQAFRIRCQPRGGYRFALPDSLIIFVTVRAAAGTECSELTEPSATDGWHQVLMALAKRCRNSFGLVIKRTSEPSFLAGGAVSARVLTGGAVSTGVLVVSA